MGRLDWLVVALYALLVLGIGAWASRRQSGTDAYFRGGRRMPWWAISFSLIATAFSAASLLGAPGEGYGHGLLWLQLQLGDLLGFVLVCLLFIPVFVRLDITTAYEYLERRFDLKTRSLGAACFLLFVVARLGGLLYGAALVVAQVAGIPLSAAILAVGAVAILYTAFGGIEAVVWTDVLQFGAVLSGVGAAIWVVAGEFDGGLPALWAEAARAGKLRVLDPSWNASSIRTLPTAVLAYGTLVFAVAGTNQQSVQRYVSCSDVRSAQKATLLAWLSGLVGVAGCLLLGAFLYVFYQARPEALPQGLSGDKIFPHFIASELPPGVAGLLVAAVFAAAMSSIDSALHSLSTSLVVDFYRRIFRPKAAEARCLSVARWLILFWGILGIAAAFYVARLGEGLLPFMVKYTTCFLGPVLGLFLLGMLSRRANGDGAFWGALAAAALLIGLSQAAWFKLPGIWYSAFTAPVAFGLGWLFSLAGAAPAVKNLKGLVLAPGDLARAVRGR